jgi:hypothetical protein
LWLPPGKWIDWWTLDPLASGSVSRQAPLTVLPLFLKSGGVVAMLDPTIMTLAPATDVSVVTLEKVAGVLDVRAAIDLAAPGGSSKLVEGTTLQTMLSQGAAALPNGITTAPDDATLSTCSACGKIDTLPSGVTRVRITTASEAQGTLAAGALSLSHAGPTPQRIRWDVAVLP